MKFNISIDTALTTIRKNLDDHIKELAEAKEVWTEKAKGALDKLKEAVDRDGLKASHKELNELFVNMPHDNRSDYSRCIGAMEKAKESGQTHVEMSETDYDALFNDNWQWRLYSKMANSTYSRSH